MSKGKPKKVKNSAGIRKPRIPAVIDAYSGSGFHTPGKYGTSERRNGRREIDRQRD